MRAADVMTRDVITVGPDTAVKQAAEVLAEHGFTALPVVDDDGRLIGVVSEADLVRDRFPTDPRNRRPATDDHDRVVAQRVDEVMSTPAEAMAASTDVVLLARTMLADRHRFIPIVDGSRIVGVVTRGDLVGVLARSDEDIATEVRRKLAGYGGSGRWTVSVHDGEVLVRDEYDDAVDRHVALVLAEAVPGVVRATVRSVPAGDQR